MTLTSEKFDQKFQSSGCDRVVPGHSFKYVAALQAAAIPAIGTPQAQDRLVYATPDQPSLLQSLSVSPEAAFITGASLKIDGGLAA
ncbi:hypothetical protein [Nostoc sp.]|uniref:hypothetical protein n=1 Tax=Nostoc sp. TaxID=1180 RepID=UPI002FFD3F16